MNEYSSDILKKNIPLKSIEFFEKKAFLNNKKYF